MDKDTQAINICVIANLIVLSAGVVENLAGDHIQTPDNYSDLYADVSNDITRTLKEGPVNA
tara:strand:- start:215977 stop:216159 length:183 start_codon:yes stop_codon:yes gene_type:complete